MEKTEIEISSTIIKLILKSFGFSVIAIYLLNHAGNFYTQYNNLESNGVRALNSYSTITPETTVTLSYKSPLGIEYVYPTNFKTAETWTEGKGMKSYPVKAQCYLIATFKSIFYVVFLAVLIGVGLSFFSKHKISIK
ncbi:hypothetical protein [Flavobacterium sp. CAN_S2]|uniref:hypothetical protein n=1 Tax=Flavobacterium sp. CAN_S2 TaxID=2787726 RepID=UPI0018C9553C